MENLMFNLRRLVFSNTAKATGYIFSGNAVSSFFAVVFSILAARFLGPKDWGIVAAVTSFIPVLIALTDLGVGSALFKYATGKWGTREDYKAVRAFKIALSLRLASLFVPSLLLVLFARSLSK